MPLLNYTTDVGGISMERLTEPGGSRCEGCQDAGECAYIAGEFPVPCPDAVRYERLRVYEDKGVELAERAFSDNDGYGKTWLAYRHKPEAGTTCNGFGEVMVPMTNGDRIRDMSDEELANFLAYIWATSARAWQKDLGETLYWLQQPAEEDDHEQ